MTGKNIYLIGFMGSGKTTIGRTLGRRLGYTTIDMDSYIEAQEGMTIPEIFAQVGEEGFRNMEKKYLEEISKIPRKMVVSCGGGIVLESKNADTMKEYGRIIYLQASCHTLAERVAKEQKDNGYIRPLLKDCYGNMEALEERIFNMKEKRVSLYKAASDICVDTDGKSPDEICQEISKKLHI